MIYNKQKRMSMLKAFLSHSSKNKDYVEKIAKELTQNWCTYDSFTFEFATKTKDEIIKHIKEDSIFVVFLSDKALESTWVKDELELVYKELKNGYSKRIMPIIVDDSITHKDERIPKWLSKDYNIQTIRKYKKAVHRIKQEIIKLHWSIDSKKMKKDTLFVGRNKLMEVLEEKHREKFTPPFSVIASGIDGIGRRTILKEYYCKVTGTDKSKYIPTIFLETNESIEDFILKVVDLGLTKDITNKDLLSMSIDEKVDFLASLFQDLEKEKEILLLEDNGCLVLLDRELNSWFKSLLHKINRYTKTTILLVASKYKLKKSILLEIDSLSAVDVFEFESKEINWAFNEFLKAHSIELEEDKYDFIKSIFSGHPEQIKYTITLLEKEGYPYLYKNIGLIADFNIQKVSYLLNQYKDNNQAKSLLAMLAMFDYIDYELLYLLIEDDKNYSELIEEFIANSICNELGANKESIKLNRAIKDTIKRSEWKVDNNLNKKLEEHINGFFKENIDYEIHDKTLSDYFFTMKELLSNKKDIDISKLIPSILLKSIMDLYDIKKNWKRVTELAEQSLYENNTITDEEIERQMRNYLCLSYIRTNEDNKFLTEVQKISGASHNFLLGFYYRKKARFGEALEQLKKAILQSPNLTRAKRELAQVYISIHDFESALELSKELYSQDRKNPYLFQAYVSCLFKINDDNKNKEIEDLFLEFEKYKHGNVIAEEFYEVENAKFLSQNDDKLALNKIEDAVKRYSDSVYPLLAKFEIATKLYEIEIMKETNMQLNKNFTKLPDKNIITINEAIILAHEGKLNIAKDKIIQLRNYPHKAQANLIDRLEKINQKYINQVYKK